MPVEHTRRISYFSSCKGSRIRLKVVILFPLPGSLIGSQREVNIPRWKIRKAVFFRLQFLARLRRCFATENRKVNYSGRPLYSIVRKINVPAVDYENYNLFCPWPLVEKDAFVLKGDLKRRTRKSNEGQWRHLLQYQTLKVTGSFSLIHNLSKGAKTCDH